jgi:hypothetical protein
MNLFNAFTRFILVAELTERGIFANRQTRNGAPHPHKKSPAECQSAAADSEAEHA